MNATNGKSVTQRTNSSIDKHISWTRQLRNDTKSTLSKLQKISNKAVEQITGHDPLKLDYQPFPIRQSYRIRQIMDTESDYHGEEEEKTPERPWKANRSHTLTQYEGSKINSSTNCRTPFGFGNNTSNPGNVNYSHSYYPAARLRKSHDPDRLASLSQPKPLPPIPHKKRRTVYRKSISLLKKNMTLSSELPPRDDAKLILLNSTKASKYSECLNVLTWIF
jgi:hypothetical protein